MTTYTKRGGTVFVGDKRDISSHDTLPVGNYIVKYNDLMDEYFLEEVEKFTIDFKLYGDTQKRTARILNTFMSRPATTGVLLSGEKGSGKSLLGKNISVEAYSMGIPTIIVNKDWHGDTFNRFVQMIEQPAIIMLDEFEKTYEPEKQEKILTLLDGTFPSKKLFILTCNDMYRVDAHLSNRPGRIFYNIDFDGLGESHIREYCEENLIDQSHIDLICKVATAFTAFNFDMLKALVEEMNRYNESPLDSLRLINAKPQKAGECQYKISVMENGASFVGKFDPTVVTKNPLDASERTYVYLYPKQKAGTSSTKELRPVETICDSDDGETRLMITSSDLKEFDSTKGIMVFSKNGYDVIFEKQEVTKFSFDKYF